MSDSPNIAEQLVARMNSLAMTATPQEPTPVAPPPVTEDEITDMTEDEKQAVGPLTEQEIKETVNRWVMEDSGSPLEERTTAGEMVAIFIGRKQQRGSEVSVSRIRTIVYELVPKNENEPETEHVHTKSTPAPKPSRPEELLPLIESGVARFESGTWLVNRCSVCGQFKNECCGQIRTVAATRGDGTLTSLGRQAVGLEPIRTPVLQTPEQTEKSLTESSWWSTFSGFDELEDGGLKMYIENFLPEGVTIISSLPKEGKTWLALSIVKALTTGKPLFGKTGFEVSEQVPVLYLAAEVSDRAFKHRVSKFGITNDKTKFLCRTLTKGMIGLQNPDLESAVRALKPVVILDVLSCFNQSEDEDDAVQNQKLRGMISNLRSQGAPVIIVLHHTTKDFKDKPTKERAVRGSGDILAMVDVVWALMMDDRLFQSGIKEVDVIGWGRDFEASPMRLALTGKTGVKTLSTFGPGVVSVIDETGDLGWVDKEAVREAAEKADQALEDTLVQMVQADPKVSLRTLANDVGQSYRRVRDTLEDLGWTRGKSKHAVWTKE